MHGRNYHRAGEIQAGDEKMNSSGYENFLGSKKQASYKDPELDEYEKARLPGIPLVDNDGCMYPLTGSDSDHMFCGEDIVEGRYCKHHAEKCKGYQGFNFSYKSSYDRNIVYLWGS